MSPFPATPQEQLDILAVGTQEIVQRSELLQKLQRSYTTGKPLVVKLGADPSAPDIHLGHTVVLQKLRQFQRLGHQVVFLIGDFTGRIGDPTGKKKTRPALSEAEILANAETYRAQIGKILDLEKIRIAFNSEWLGTMTFADVLKLTSQYTVARMLERDDFANRFKSQTPISVVEFMYPLMQGYDSVALAADVELGGLDQTFNLLVGRDLQRSYGQEPQVTMTMPILEGLDGVEKMSKSLGNYVGINESPRNIFGKLMSLPDALMPRYFELLTDLRPDEQATLKDRCAQEPRNMKVALARQITSRFHGDVAGQAAADEFEKMFGKAGDGLPDDLQEARVPTPPDGLPLVRVLTLSGLVPSGQEAKRLLQQGGVKVDQARVDDPQKRFHVGDEFILQAGKRAFRRIFMISE